MRVPSAGSESSVDSAQLTIVIGGHGGERGLGHVYTVPSDVLLADNSIGQPDLLFVSRERLHILTAPNVKGAPDLVVEVISPSSTRIDQETTRTLDEQYGVRHYWVFEPSERWMRAFELYAFGSYERIAEASDEAPFGSPPFPDLIIPLARLWRSWRCSGDALGR